MRYGDAFRLRGHCRGSEYQYECETGEHVSHSSNELLNFESGQHPRVSKTITLVQVIANDSYANINHLNNSSIEGGTTVHMVPLDSYDLHHLRG
jgi:hypothetical protein